MISLADDAREIANLCARAAGITPCPGCGCSAITGPCKIILNDDPEQWGFCVPSGTHGLMFGGFMTQEIIATGFTPLAPPVDQRAVAAAMEMVGRIGELHASIEEVRRLRCLVSSTPSSVRDLHEAERAVGWRVLNLLGNGP